MKITVHTSEKEGMFRSGSSAELNALMTGLVEKGTLPFAMTVIERHDDVAYWCWCGLAPAYPGSPSGTEHAASGLFND